MALHEHRHFGRAAQACHISQPALSNALRALEEEFGTSIVKRGRVFEGFTPEGELIFQAALRILHEHEQLKQELKSADGHPRGTLRIGAVPSVMPIAARFAAMLQARHPGILPVVRSMSSPDIETGLETLALDMGLGYMARLGRRSMPFKPILQNTEHNILFRRASGLPSASMRMGPELTWAEAARQPLCLLTPEMHNRAIVNAALAEAGAQVVPAMETDSVLALALSVLDGQVCSILPGALVGAIRGFMALEAVPLIQPTITTPIGFMVLDMNRPSRALSAALALAEDADWLRHAGDHSGLLGA